MTWTFYFLLMACLLIPTVIVGVSDSIEKEERPAKKRNVQLKKEGKRKDAFRGEYTTRGRNNANTY